MNSTYASQSQIVIKIIRTCLVICKAMINLNAHSLCEVMQNEVSP